MFVKITNGQVDQYPYTIGDLRKANPNISFPKSISAETLAQYNVYAVVNAPTPEYNSRTHRLVTQQPIQVDGVWTVTRIAVAKDQAQIDNETEQQKAQVRAERDRKLAETDWMALSDNTLTEAWATYRQALRDLPSTDGFPYNVVWPDKPE